MFQYSSLLYFPARRQNGSSSFVSPSCTEQRYGLAVGGYMKAIPALSLSVVGRGGWMWWLDRNWREVTEKKKTQYSYEVKSPPFFSLKATNEILGAIVELYSLCLSHSAAYETS